MPVPASILPLHFGTSDPIHSGSIPECRSPLLALLLSMRSIYRYLYSRIASRYYLKTVPWRPLDSLMFQMLRGVPCPVNPGEAPAHVKDCGCELPSQIKNLSSTFNGTLWLKSIIRLDSSPLVTDLKNLPDSGQKNISVSRVSKFCKNWSNVVLSSL